MARRLLAAVAAVVAAGVVAALFAPRPAAADEIGPCEVRVGDTPVRGRSATDRSQAIRVEASEPLALTATSTEPISGYRAEAQVAGIRWTIGTAGADGFLWQRNIDTPSNAWLGVGLYRLRITTFTPGDDCLAMVMIHLAGRNPLTTVAGAAGVLAVIAGAAAALATVLRGGGRRLRTDGMLGLVDTGGDRMLDRFDEVTTPGEYVGWAELACDSGARTFVEGAPGADDVTAFLERPDTRDHLATLKAGGVRVAGDAALLLPRLRWRPRLFLVRTLLAVAGAIGGLVVLQQFAIRYPNTRLLPVVAGATAAGMVLLANGARWVSVRRLNRRLARAESELSVESHEPWYPPPTGLDTYAWTPTHVVPDTGLPAFDEPDLSGAAVAELDPGLPVKVVERRGEMAQILCSNGWTGWTDAGNLQAIERP